mgnify:CR=1 FL=1
MIASNTEKFIGFQIGNLRFLDSFKFLGTSLDALTQNLLKSGEDKFQITKNAFPGSSTVFRKGIYPYEYMDSYSRFSETELPPQSAFYSQLNDHHITDEEYQLAQAAWTEFECKTMKNYHDFYLKLDVALLADVFENFRAISHSAYGLDPAHYWTLPGFSWDACLKETGVKLELFTEPDANKYLFIENAIRGGVSMITHRHAKANNGMDMDPRSRHLGFYTWTATTSTAGQCPNPYPPGSLGG